MLGNVQWWKLRMARIFNNLTVLSFLGYWPLFRCLTFMHVWQAEIPTNPPVWPIYRCVQCPHSDAEQTIAINFLFTTVNARMRIIKIKYADLNFSTHHILHSIPFHFMSFRTYYIRGYARIQAPCKCISLQQVSCVYGIDRPCLFTTFYLPFHV